MTRTDLLGTVNHVPPEPDGAFRHNFGEACEFRAARHPVCRARRKPSRLKIAMAATAAAGGIAANGAVPWAGATSGLPADQHAVTTGNDLTAFDTREAFHAATEPRHMVSAGTPTITNLTGKQAIVVSASLGRLIPARSRAAKRPALVVPAKAHGHAALKRAKTARITRQGAPHAPAPSKPYLIYDSVTPTAIPAGRNVAAYSDGPYAASSSEVAGRRHVLWIDVYDSNPNAGALDVEPGDATPAGAAAWVAARLTKDPHSDAIVYTMQSWWPAVIARIGTLPTTMRRRVRYWIADPTGYPHILPGADATQWYWGPNYDISTASPQFRN